MKIRIQDFGPIRDFTFDLGKDIHLLYGKNGTGKSYAVYCIYILLKNLLTDEEGHISIPRYVDEESSFFKEQARKAIQKAETGDNADISDEVERILEFAFSNVVQNIRDIISNTYGALPNVSNRLSNGYFKLSIDSQKFFVSLSDRGNDTTVFNFKLRERVLLMRDSDELLSCFFDNGVIIDSFYNDKPPLWAICTQVLLNVRLDFNLLASDLHFLPASRSGLYQGLNSFGPIIAELSKQRHLIKRKIELPTLSETVSDYFLALSSIEKMDTNKGLERIVADIESKILKGEVTYSIDDQKITFNPVGTNLKLDLSASSSMVAELSSIVTYLKYVLKGQNSKRRRNSGILDENKDSYEILFIEEPEAHLHPEAQVKLMEILAELPKHNIKVVMTSHSNYMFNKLTNLILEKKVNPDKVATYHMVMTDKGSVVEDDMPVTDEGIEDSNFVAVSEQLYEERMRLFDEMNE